MTDKDYDDIALVVEGIEGLMAVCEIGDDPYSIEVTALSGGKAVSDVLVEMCLDEGALKQGRATIIDEMGHDFGHLSLATHVLKTDDKGKAHFKLRLEKSGEVTVKFLYRHVSSRQDKEQKKDFSIFVEKLDPAARHGNKTMGQFGQFGFNKPADHRFACEIEAPESLTVGASAMVRVKITEQGKPAEDASVSLLVQSLNIEVLMLSDLSAPMRSNTGSTNKNGFAVFRLTHQAKQAEEVTFRVLWRVDTTKGEKDGIIKFTDKKEEKKMADKDKTKKAEKKKKTEKVGGGYLGIYMICLLVAVIVAGIIGIHVHTDKGFIGWMKDRLAYEAATPVFLTNGDKAAHNKPVKKATAKPETSADNALASLTDDPWAEEANQSTMPEGEDEQDEIVIKPDPVDEVEPVEDSEETDVPAGMVFTEQDAQGTFDIRIVNASLSADLAQKDELAIKLEKLAKSKQQLEQENAALAQKNREISQKLKKLTYVIQSKVDCRGSAYSREPGNVIVFHGCTAWVEKKAKKKHKKKKPTAAKSTAKPKPEAKVKKKPKPKAAKDNLGAEAYDKMVEKMEKKKQKQKQEVKKRLDKFPDSV